MHHSVLKTIADSAIGQKILAEAAVEQLATRRALVDERERIRTTGERRGKEAADTYAKAKAARDKADVELKLAVQREMEAMGAWSAVSSSIERGINLCNRELEATADSRIDELLSWLGAALSKACAAPTPTDPRPPSIGVRMLGLAPEPRDESRKIPATTIIQAAIGEARGLKQQALDAKQLERRIAEITATVPSEYSHARAG